MKSIFKTIGNYTKEKRIAAGLSQVAVARKLGYGSAQFVSNVERGLCGYPLRNLRKLEKVLGVDLKHMQALLVSAYDAEVSSAFFPKKKTKPRAANPYRHGCNPALIRFSGNGEVK